MPFFEGLLFVEFRFADFERYQEEGCLRIKQQESVQNGYSTQKP